MKAVFVSNTVSKLLDTVRIISVSSLHISRLFTVTTKLHSNIIRGQAWGAKGTRTQAYDRARESGAIWRVGTDSCKYLRHKKLHISTSRGHYNLGQRYNSHTVCRTLKNLVSPDSLNGAESLCNGHAHFHLESFFSTKSQKLENLLFRTPPWDSVWSVWNLARRVFSWTWSKVIKRIANY